jgi:hypothetical protein
MHARWVIMCARKLGKDNGRPQGGGEKGCENEKAKGGGQEGSPDTKAKSGRSESGGGSEAEEANESKRGNVPCCYCSATHSRDSAGTGKQRRSARYRFAAGQQTVIAYQYVAVIETGALPPFIQPLHMPMLP